MVRPGRSFLRRIFEAIAIVHWPHHKVQLNFEVRSDLAWWNSSLELWNGISMLWNIHSKNPDVRVISDGSVVEQSGRMNGASCRGMLTLKMRTLQLKN